MSKFTNRLLLIDTFVTNDYYGRSEAIKSYFNIGNIDSLLSKINSEDNELIKSKDICHFLCNQKEDLIEFIKEDILANKNVYMRYLSQKHYSKRICFESLDEIEIFKKSMNTNNFLYSEEFAYVLRNGASKERVLKVIDFFEGNDLVIGTSRGRLVIDEDKVKDMIINDYIWDFSDEEILSIIKNSNRIGINYLGLNKDSLDVLKNKNSIYTHVLNKENLDLIDTISNIIADEDEDKDDNFYGYGYISSDFKSILYELRDGINNVVDVLNEKYTEKDVKKQLMKSFIEAMQYEYICSVDDANLFSNKIKYDFKPNEALDIGLDFAGITRDFYNSIDASYDDVTMLILLKKSLPKGFFRKVINSTKLARSILYVDSCVLREVANVLELSQLNETQIDNLISMIYSSAHSLSCFVKDFSGIEYKLSFDEFKCVFDNRAYITTSIINGIKNMKQSARLLKLKAVIEINKTLQNKDFCISRKMIDEYIVDKDMIALMKKNNPLRISDMGDYIEYKVIDSIIPIDSISYLNKIKFLFKNGYSLNDVKELNVEDIDSRVWSSGELVDLTSKMNLSDSFKEEYKDNIIEFLSSEEYRLVNSYYKNPYSTSKQKNGVMLIGKSLIANKYEDLKFVRGDIKKEVSIDISDEAFDAWKRTDTLTKGDYTIQDSSDFKYIMKMGEIPVRSCMHYVNGMYSHCLLSNFDTSKKMIVIHKNGKYVGRAILRLTVMSDTNETVSSSSLEFVDVDNNSNDMNKVNDTSKNETIIFLEKAYTTLDGGDFKECYSMIVELLKEKANEMGAKLVTSYNYGGYIEDDCSEKYKYVFITASKNGAQYLDSFDGSTSNSYCYKKGRVYIY